MADRAHRLTMGLVWLARLAVAAVFVYAAVPKAIDIAAFAESIRNYQAFPVWSVHLLAAWVPMLELVGAASLLTGSKRRAGAVVLGVLTVAFLVLIASAIVRGIDLQCGCFGQKTEGDPLGWSEFARDVVLLVGVIIAGWEPRRPQRPPADAS